MLMLKGTNSLLSFLRNSFKTKLVHDSETILMYDEWKAMLNVLGFKV